MPLRIPVHGVRELKPTIAPASIAPVHTDTRASWTCLWVGTGRCERDTPRETTFPQSCGNSQTGGLLGIGGCAARIRVITMHQSRDLIELDPIELQTNSSSEHGPAKWPSQDEKRTHWRQRKAPRCARRGRPPVVQLGPRELKSMVSMCVQSM